MIETEEQWHFEQSSQSLATGWYMQTPSSFLQYEEEIQKLTAQLMQHAQPESSFLFQNDNVRVSKRIEQEPTFTTIYNIEIEGVSQAGKQGKDEVDDGAIREIVQETTQNTRITDNDNSGSDFRIKRLLVEEPIQIVNQVSCETVAVQTEEMPSVRIVEPERVQPVIKLPINSQPTQTAITSKDIIMLQSLPERMRMIAEEVSSSMLMQLNKIRYFMETEGVLHSQTVEGIQESLVKFTEVMRLAIEKKEQLTTTIDRKQVTSANKLNFYVDRQDRIMQFSDRPREPIHLSPPKTERSEPIKKQDMPFESPEERMHKPYESPKIFEKLESFGSLPKTPATVREIQEISSSLHEQSLQRLLSILNSLYEKLQEKNQEISHLRQLTSRFQKSIIEEREHFQNQQRTMQQEFNSQIKILLQNISKYESITIDLKSKIEQLSSKQRPIISAEHIDNLIITNLNEEITILTEQLNRANKQIESKAQRINQLTMILYNQQALEKIQKNSYPATQVQIFRLIGQIRVLKTQLQKTTQTNNILQYRLMEHQPCQRHLQLIRQLEYVIKNYDTIVVPNLQTKITEYKKLYEIADDKIRKLEEQHRKVSMEYIKMQELYRKSPMKTYELKKIVMSPNKTLETSRMRYRYTSDSCRLDEVIRRKQTSNTFFGLVFLLKLCDLAETLIKDKNIKILQTDSIYLLNFQPEQPKLMKLKLLEAGEHQRKYLAPEIIQKRKPHSEATIIWNIGILMDECLNRRNYFRTEREVVDALRIYRYDNQQMPEMKRLMESMLEKEAAQRMSIGAVKAMAQLELDRFQRQNAREFS